MPFTTEEFLNLFEEYNLSLWPLHMILYSLGIFAILFIIMRKRTEGVAVNVMLAILWFWMGAVYHLLYFSTINPMAFVFGILFIVQSAIFIWAGVLGNQLVYRWKLDFKGITGLLFVIFSFLIYPFLSSFFGHSYPQTPTFGLPCPTTIFTFGILLFSARRVPWYIFIIPLVWSFIGFFAAVNLSMKEDYSLLIAGLIGALFLIFSRYPEKVSRG
ncbi:MAG TPA: hypothetical protein ENO10_03065 [Salinimicrobium catena]|uniref:Uncharacterized protein n=1 Tax=Salinimicrobium catena TaxID=390640 RepID=A0A7C2M5I8_9FLAO|nr:hypothetical protein [Salinimicrobium catena]